MRSDHGGLHAALAQGCRTPGPRLRASARWSRGAARGRPAGCVTPRPGGESATAIARQLRDLVEQLTTTAQGQAGSPGVLVISDAGYDAPCLVHLLRDLPLQVLARMRSDRVLRRPAPTPQPHTRGRSPGTAASSVFGQPGTRGAPDTENVTDTRIHGTAVAHSWGRLHPRLTHRSSWATADSTLPVVEGRVIRLDIDHLPSGASPKPVRL